MNMKDLKVEIKYEIINMTKGYIQEPNMKIYDLGLTISGSHRFDVWVGYDKIAKIYWTANKRLLKIFAGKKTVIKKLNDSTDGSAVAHVLTAAIQLI